jgi:hypothetical protein
MIVLKHLLLELLIGKNKSARSRAIAIELLVDLEPMRTEDGSSNEVSVAVFQSSLTLSLTNQWWRRYVSVSQVTLVALPTLIE